jgi:hypothetical protein
MTTDVILQPCPWEAVVILNLRVLFPCRLVNSLGRAIADGVRRRLLTAEAGFNPTVVRVGLVADKVDWCKCLSNHFCFPLPINIPPVLDRHLSSGADIKGPVEVAVPRHSVSPHS